MICRNGYSSHALPWIVTAERMGDIRAMKVQRRETAPPVARPGSVAATAAIQEPRRFGVSKLPFKLVLEVVGNAGVLSKALQGTNWQAATCPPDCSHGKLGDGGSSTFCRVEGPMMTLGKEGVCEISSVIERLKAAGARPGNTGAMRFQVSRELLDDRATQNLIKMHVANEDILFRLGQHGGKGRELNHKISYASQLSPQLASYEKAAQVHQQLQSHRNSLNTSLKGLWEFRYLDSSMDGEAVSATVQFMCGMVAAAIDGRGKWEGSHPASSTGKVDAKRWNTLMSATVPLDVAYRLATHFRNAGGQLSAPPISPKTQGLLEGLMSRQWRFEVDGNKFQTAPAVAERLAYSADETPLTMVDPAGNPTVVPIAAVTTTLLAAAMSSKGVRFHHCPAKGSASESNPVRLADVHQQLSDGGVRVTLPQWRLWKFWPRKTITITSPQELDTLAARV